MAARLQLLLAEYERVRLSIADRITTLNTASDHLQCSRAAHDVLEINWTKSSAGAYGARFPQDAGWPGASHPTQEAHDRAHRSY
jgi:hypothetical protein